VLSNVQAGRSASNVSSLAGVDVSDYEVISADDVDDVYAGTSVPGEFRPLTEALGS
jgi:hypothetical protein